MRQYSGHRCRQVLARWSSTYEACKSRLWGLAKMKASARLPCQGPYGAEAGKGAWYGLWRSSTLRMLLGVWACVVRLRVGQGWEAQEVLRIKKVGGFMCLSLGSASGLNKDGYPVSPGSTVIRPPQDRLLSPRVSRLEPWERDYELPKLPPANTSHSLWNRVAQIRQVLQHGAGGPA